VSGSSRALIGADGWTLLFDSGLSIAWADPVRGADKHRADEAVLLVRLEELRPLIVALLERHPDVEIGDINEVALGVREDDMPRKLELPCILEVTMTIKKTCTLRIAVKNGTPAAIVLLMQDAKHLLTTSGAV
jgi:hypothetical protein